jgi:3-phosphoshikimate 1-carboxyvinyltransferase
MNNDSTLPLTIIPAAEINPINYNMPVASAQVKSCILIAGLHNESETSVIEKEQSRNHTEKMLGLPVCIVDGKIILSSSRKFYPKPNDYFIPGDISSAAFHIVLTLLTPNSELFIKDVSLNPTRIGFINLLKDMGANISFENIRTSSNEDYGDVLVKTSHLKNIKIDLEIIPNIIDEIPILTIAGIFAEGDFEIENAKELRVKESDRIKSICYNLNLLGLKVKEREDGFSISGSIKKIKPIFERIFLSGAVSGMMVTGVPTFIKEFSPGKRFRVTQTLFILFTWNTGCPFSTYTPSFIDNSPDSFIGIICWDELIVFPASRICPV